MQALQTHTEARIFGLDLIRAIAILLVMASHIYYLVDCTNPLMNTLSGLLGHTGVELFFVLSGFLIGKILLQQYLTNSFSSRFLLIYIKRRWLRTLPSYYLVFFVNISIALLFTNPINNWYQYLFFLQNFKNYHITFFTESWSLSVEEWTYILLPLSLYLIAKYFSNSSKKYTFLFTICFLILIAHVFRYFHFLNNQITDMKIWNTNLRSIVLFRFDSIIFGVLLSWFFIFYKNFLLKYRIYFLIIAGHLYVIQFLILNVLKVDIISCPIYFSVFYFSLSTFTFLLAFPFFIFWKSSIAIIAKPVLFISKTSYSAYLWHYSIIIVMLKYFNYYFSLSANSLCFWYFTLTFSLSYLLFRFFEFPILNVRKRLNDSDVDKKL